MSCKPLADYVYGFVDEVGEIQDHLGDCAKCRADLERLEEEKSFLADGAMLVRAPEPKRHPWALAAAAAVCLALLAVVLFRPDRVPLSVALPGIEKRESEPADTNFPRPAATLEEAIRTIRAQKNYRVKFDLRIEAPALDPMVVRGESVFVRPGVLFVQYEASGGDRKRIVRIGDRAWIYHEILEDWVTKEELGSPSAGRGISDPDGVLGALLGRVREARKQNGSYRIELLPEDARSILGWTLDQPFVSMEAEATMERGILRKASFRAETGPAERTSYRAWIELVRFNMDDSLDFGVPIPDHIRRAIEEARRIRD